MIILGLSVLIVLYVLAQAERRHAHRRQKSYEDYIWQREEEHPIPPKPR